MCLPSLSPMHAHTHPHTRTLSILRQGMRNLCSTWNTESGSGGAAWHRRLLEARTQLRWGLRLPVLMLSHFGNALHRVAVLEVGPEGLRALLLSGRHMGMTTLGSQRKDTGKLGVKVQGGAPKWSPK